MGKRYYCDYCDRFFQDTMHNRKKHLNSVQHHRAKKSWFDRFKDSSAVLQDEQAKKPCRQFYFKGYCDFSPNCRFSHMTEEGFARLKRQVEEERLGVEGGDDRVLSERRVDDWLLRWTKRRTSDDREEARSEEDPEEEPVQIPPLLLSVPDLPPSLLPPPPRGWRAAADSEWG